MNVVSCLCISLDVSFFNEGTVYTFISNNFAALKRRLSLKAFLMEDKGPFLKKIVLHRCVWPSIVRTSLAM